jgi:hypothetical protein
MVVQLAASVADDRTARISRWLLLSRDAVDSDADQFRSFDSFLLRREPFNEIIASDLTMYH